ncbi:hypothetical protein ITP53_08565 [Nonomuraea sp. K274]|uniref:Intracellular septation protein A n=2 Tax=Nonomuraea cypriaca TaxID=1187855 RepID=A0A931A883_9ACTN|nr:hypothetical protein [Nonomuraea cypriaca]
MLGVLVFEFAGPLAIFYGLRAAGVNQWLALLCGSVLPAGRAVHGIVTERRVSGTTMFVLGAMALTVVMSFVTGSPRVLLIRDAWGSAALGLWALISLLGRRPFLYEGTRMFLDPGKQEIWASNWERFPEFRHALRAVTAVWGVAFLADTGVRVVMAMALPIDLVPLLDDVLLVVTLLVLVAFQRLYGRVCLRRHGLRIRGVEMSRIAEPEPS